MYWIASLLNIFQYFGSYHWSRSQKAYWTNILESVQILKHLNKLPAKLMSSKSLSRLLVAMVSDLCNHFCCSFTLYSFHFIFVST